MADHLNIFNPYFPLDFFPSRVGTRQTTARMMDAGGLAAGCFDPATGVAHIPVGITAYDRAVRRHEATHAIVPVKGQIKMTALFQGVEDMRIHAFAQSGHNDTSRRDEIVMALTDLRNVHKNLWKMNTLNPTQLRIALVPTARALTILRYGLTHEKGFAKPEAVRRTQKMIDKVVAFFEKKIGKTGLLKSIEEATDALELDNVNTAYRLMKPFMSLSNKDAELPKQKQPKQQPQKQQQKQQDEPMNNPSLSADDEDEEEQDEQDNDESNDEESEDESESKDSDKQSDGKDSKDEEKKEKSKSKKSEDKDESEDEDGGEQSEDGDESEDEESDSKSSGKGESEDEDGNDSEDSNTDMDGEGEENDSDDYKDVENDGDADGEGSDGEGSKGESEADADPLEDDPENDVTCNEKDIAPTAGTKGGIGKGSDLQQALEDGRLTAESVALLDPETLEKILARGASGSYGMPEMYIHKLDYRMSKKITEGRSEKLANSGMRIRLNRIPRIFDPKPGKIFERTGQQKGGTVLIDASGSMNLTDERLAKLAERLPIGQIAYYSGGGYSSTYHNGKSYWGTLVIYSKDGRSFQKRDGESLPFIHYGNEVDFQALQWLLKQPGPRWLVSDQYFCGDSDVSNKAAVELGRKAFARKMINCQPTLSHLEVELKMRTELEAPDSEEHFDQLMKRLIPCAACEGVGKIKYKNAAGRWDYTWVPCDACQGKGWRKLQQL